MVDQNEVAVVWVIREAQAKADWRPWTVAGTVARVTRRLCLPSVHPSQSPLPSPHPIPPRAAIAEREWGAWQRKSLLRNHIHWSEDSEGWSSPA